ncbi:MAG: hypothetical protein KBD85_03330 [Elusimicrobia bacterium]|nr:hypothetical protein [Elusimicrobiota bacterium]MBP9127961.1 hypothetical protein [Elusimicrobiota bacterium]MBP9699030.1 hypothetical protein [Elusimicrobiota bacterium]
MRRCQRGGVVWDVFLIVVVCGVGFIAWTTRDRWGGPVGEAVRRWVPSGASVDVPMKADLKSVSALAQSRLREILADSGVKEKDITSSFNEERRDGGTVWLESTIELDRPKKFNEGFFLRRVLIDGAENGIALMKDYREKGAWTVEFGDRVRVYQRFRFRGPSHS